MIAVSACDPDDPPNPDPTPISTRVRMDRGSTDFFGFPWPSDLRITDDGTIDLTGFPGLGRARLGMSANVSAAADDLRGFSTTGASYFTFTAAIDSASLPERDTWASDAASVMLVALDSGERIPVRTRFFSQATASRPGLLLAVGPYPGFVLRPHTKYAAILFSDLRDESGHAVAEATAMTALRAGTGDADLAAQWNDVERYVDTSTAHNSSEVIGFSVFTTADVQRELFAVANAVAQRTDVQVLASVESWTMLTSCFCVGPECSPAALFDATLSMPRWQQPTTLTLSATAVRARGGAIQIDPQGRAVQQATESGVPARIAVPCGAPPVDGWPILVRGGGSSSNYDHGNIVWDTQFAAADRDLTHVVLSASPYLTGIERRDPARVDLMARIGSRLGFDSTPDQAAGALYSDPLNLRAARTNIVQGTSEILWLQRIAKVLAPVADRFGQTTDDAQLQSGAFQTDRSRVAVEGHSQGADETLLALATADHDAASLNGVGGLNAIENAVHRGDMRALIDRIFRLTPGEYEPLHPLATLLQLLLDGSDAINYAGSVRTRNLLVTNGFQDGCATRESTQALATAFVREMQLDYADTALLGLPEPQGLALLGVSPLRLPIRGNRADGGTGVYLFLEGGHEGSGTEAVVGRFLSDVGTGATPEIAPLPYGPYSLYTCGARAD